MGSSARKKKDKKKDFQKPKLKVGKTRPKASNFTDTSFKSKSIVLSRQSLSITAPSSSTQFSHHVSLLSSRSDNQRKDSLGYLMNAIASQPMDTSLQQPVSILLPKLLPLCLDSSNGVRSHLLKIFRLLPPREVEDHVDQILLYIRAGMTHLAADIRNSSMDILGWAIDVSGRALVSCPGGWVKTLKCFIAMLGWPNESLPASWSSIKASYGKAGSEGKALVKSLNTLASFLRAGLLEDDLENDNTSSFIGFPLTHSIQHILPKKSRCFANLNLFGSPRDEESEIYEDCEDRQKVFGQSFQLAIEKGLEGAKQEGGEVGRAAAGVKKVLLEGMVEHEVVDT